MTSKKPIRKTLTTLSLLLQTNSLLDVNKALEKEAFSKNHFMPFHVIKLKRHFFEQFSRMFFLIRTNIWVIEVDIFPSMIRKESRKQIFTSSIIWHKINTCGAIVPLKYFFQKLYNFSSQQTHEKSNMLHLYAFAFFLRFRPVESPLITRILFPEFKMRIACPYFKPADQPNAFEK